ncbi:MAG TPA: site-2 protease family protein [Oceanospirillaceae bacterium]|nr:site-2 protease family protein [Oceanospirillaceae bacterium]
MQQQVPAPKGRARLAIMLGIGLKLFKSIKVVKVALIGMALSGWTILLSFEFAATLLAVLMFHEYGHIRAMKHFGIPTKGIYIIPFVGGIAVGEQPKTHWQDLYIAMMGPVFGLVMTLGFFVAYSLTESHFVGLVASISALLNLVNLLPVLPLDGGHVIKALVYSGRSRFIYVGLVVISALLIFYCFTNGFALIGFFGIMGLVDLLSDWRSFDYDPKHKLDTYGIIFSLVWYLLTAAALIGMIVWLAALEIPGSELAMAILGA